jgi:hypothetical protein
MKDLYLIVKKEWFDKIKSGEKNIEYREVTPYWHSRLVQSTEHKRFNNIIFRNGYKKDSPVIIKKWIKTDFVFDGMKTDLKVNNCVYAIYFK